jgi:YesN/AraC family two-component response regulator
MIKSGASQGEKKMAKLGSILIVDDEGEVRHILRRILNPHYEIHEAANGKEALERVYAEKIDIVTLDLSMPDLYGIEVLKEIKRLKPHVEVIIISGFGTLTRAQEAIKHGAAGFISKPFNVADILSLIGKSCDRQKFIQTKDPD